MTVAVGASYESTHDVTLAAIVRYAGASGDFTPIHWDAEEARAGGYDRFFAMGMLPAGWLSALLVQSFGPGSVTAFRVRFRSRSWLGVQVTCRAEVVGVSEAAGTSTLDVALAATGPDGEVLVDGSATVLAPPAAQSPK